MEWELFCEEQAEAPSNGNISSSDAPTQLGVYANGAAKASGTTEDVSESSTFARA